MCVIKSKLLEIIILARFLAGWSTSETEPLLADGAIWWNRSMQDIGILCLHHGSPGALYIGWNGTRHLTFLSIGLFTPVLADRKAQIADAVGPRWWSNPGLAQMVSLNSPKRLATALA